MNSHATDDDITCKGFDSQSQFPVPGFLASYMTVDQTPSSVRSATAKKCYFLFIIIILVLTSRQMLRDGWIGDGLIELLTEMRDIRFRFHYDVIVG